MAENSGNRILASFRDPKGFLFVRNGEVFRQINQAGMEDYQHLMGSGLYSQLRDKDLIVPHKEVDSRPYLANLCYKVIKPFQLPFISYPYEWCFSQFKNAALCTLQIQRAAINHSMSLVDASAFNVQFVKNRAIFIDTLSFELSSKQKPWLAYRQFCEHFLAPLALMSHCSLSAAKFFQVDLDGIPLKTASKMLPLSARLNWGLISHLFLHAKTQKKYEYTEHNKKEKIQELSLSKKGQIWLLDSLERTVRELRCPKEKSLWADYDANQGYEDLLKQEKENFVREESLRIKASKILDLGANRGHYSRIASNGTSFTIASDLDSLAVEKNYQQAVQENTGNIFPIVYDLCNPSPSLGWANQERLRLDQRFSPDLILALALIHHLSISKNIPFDYLAQLLSALGKHLIIEFVDREDPQVKRLLVHRKDKVIAYQKENFETAFKHYFSIEKQHKIGNSARYLYSMKRIS